MRTGEYQDRRHLTKIDCSNTIWILATNALDATIQDFCGRNSEVVFRDEDVQGEKLQLMKELAKEIKEDFLSKFDVCFHFPLYFFLRFKSFLRGLD
jgi:ATP-dependent Clp protease ATP-binding subunit ClpA